MAVGWLISLLPRAAVFKSMRQLICSRVGSQDERDNK
jgi:hypothetical protein